MYSAKGNFRPLLYNERYDFYALSRFEDIERCSVGWKTDIPARGTILELIKSGMQVPPGTIIFEGPPAHDIHRSLLTPVFTPRKVSAIEPKVREFCARSLDPLVGRGGFDFIPGHRRPDAHAHHRHAPRHPRAGPGGHPRTHRRQPAAHGEHHARTSTVRGWERLPVFTS